MKRLIFDGYLFDYNYYKNDDDDCTVKVIPNGEIHYGDTPFCDDEWVEKYQREKLEEMINEKSSTGQISFMKKFNVSEKEEEYWRRRVMK
jgi:hypothetical protein